MSSDSEASQLASNVSSDDPNLIKPQENQAEVCSPTKVSNTLNTDIPGGSTESMTAWTNTNNEAELVESAETEASTAPTNITEININAKESVQVPESVNQTTPVNEACNNTANELPSLTSELTKNACNESIDNSATVVNTGDPTDVLINEEEFIKRAVNLIAEGVIELTVEAH